GYRFTRVPALLRWLFIGLSLPFRGRQHAATLALQIYAGDLPEAELFAEVVQGVHADLRAEGKEVGIRRDDDGPVHVGRAIRRAPCVAEALPTEFEVPRVGYALRRAALAQLERRQGNERLVGGTDGIGAVQRPVDQRMVRRL